MSDAIRLPSRLDLLDAAEVCVAGGGLAGVAAALAAAEAGLETVLVEERGALGWEISHGLELYLTTGAERPKTLAKLLDALAAHNAFRHETLDPVAAEVLLDRIMQEAGVRVHFRALAGAVDRAAGAVRLTTKSGPLAIGARAFVDATEHSRLARQAGARFEAADTSRQTRSFLLCAVTPPDAAQTVKVDGIEEVIVRPTLWPSEACVRITYSVQDEARAESQSRFAIAKAIEALRVKLAGFEKASLTLSAHEPFALSVPKLDPRSLPEGLAVAGPSVLGRKPTLEERARLGEQAGAAVSDYLRAAVAK